MVPKIIHYCWFGKGPKTAMFEKCLNTWREKLPDYTIKEWNEDNFDVNFCAYTREAYSMRSFAHVADVCRLYALYNEGGVYLDTDVEILKSLDPFLCDGSFAGYEDERVGTAVIGAEGGEKWIGRFLKYYSYRHFINAFGHPVRTPNTYILTNVILPLMQESERPKLYPSDYFCAKNYRTGRYCITERTVAVHHFDASWRKKKNLKRRITTLGKGLMSRNFKFYRRKEYRKLNSF